MDSERSWVEESPFFSFLIREFGELRRRLFWVLGVWALFSAILFGLPVWDDSYILRFSQFLRDFLLPTGSQLIFLSPLEPMGEMIKLSLVAAVGLSVPIVAWHFVAFTALALAPGYRPFYAWFIVGAILLFVLGLAFSFLVMAPLTIQILVTYGQAAGAQPQLALGQFYSFIYLLLLGFALPFELPLVMAFLHRFNLVPVMHFKSWRFKSWGVIMVVSQFVTPDPVVTPLIFTALGILLYEAGILGCRWI